MDTIFMFNFFTLLSCLFLIWDVSNKSFQEKKIFIFLPFFIVVFMDILRLSFFFYEINEMGFWMIIETIITLNMMTLIYIFHKRLK